VLSTVFSFANPLLLANGSFGTLGGPPATPTPEPEQGPPPPSSPPPVFFFFVAVEFDSVSPSPFSVAVPVAGIFLFVVELVDVEG
jgi:hypothetical protein